MNAIKIHNDYNLCSFLGKRKSYKRLCNCLTHSGLKNVRFAKSYTQAKDFIERRVIRLVVNELRTSRAGGCAQAENYPL